MLVFLAAVLAVNPSSAQRSGDLRTLPRTSAALDAPAQRDFSKLPLTFEGNRGQTDSQVKFLSRGAGYTAFLTAGGMVLSLRPREVATTGGQAQRSATTLQFKLLGAAQNPGVAGEEEQPGKVNYFLGNDPAKWRTHVATYARVRYKNVYPGIDLVYYGNHRQMEYDFEISAGANPQRIRFEIQGASQINLDPEGNLILQAGGGELQFQSPTVYQEINGQRIAVDGGYVVQDSNHVSFKLGHYDASKPVVIDPVLVYSTYLGGSGNDQPVGIAVDSTGSVYVTGYTNSADFPLATLGALPGNTNHVFVAKLDPSGSNLIYTDYIGGGNQDYAAALALDAANHVYVTGSTQSNNFPVVKPYQAQQPGPYSGFLTEVSADGSSLLYSTYLGGNSFDQPTSVAIDGLGHALVAGYTLSPNFPVANAYQSTALANQDGLYGSYGFLTKFSPDGSTLVYSTFVSGNSNVAQDCGTPCFPAPYNVVSALALDANGNAYLAGTTNTYNFPVTSGAYLGSNTTPADASIGFVSKFGSAGNLSYSTYFYGSSGNSLGITAIAVDASGSAYITGSAQSDGTFPITSTSICDPGVNGFGCSYAFVTKFDPAGSTLLYSTFLGPNNYATPQAIVLDSADNAYVLASSQSDLFQVINGIEPYTNKSDLLLVEIDAAATTQRVATYFGGSGNDVPTGMALDAAGNLYIAGATDSSDMPVTHGSFQNQSAGNSDAFIAKIGVNDAASVSLSPAAIQYSQQQIGSTSQAQQVVLRNMGSSALSVSSISVTGDFAESDNCGSSLQAAGTCTLSITFTPNAAGPRTGSIRISDDAAGSPHIITLSGSGLGSVAALAPASLAFAGTPVGTSSAAQPVILSNSGNSALNIGTIQVNGDYTQTNNCPTALPSGSNCTVNVTFTPTATGSRTGQLTISDSAQGSPHTAGLAGTGSDFSLATANGSATIKAGGTATYTFTVAPVGGAFASAVKLSCSGAPSQTTCSLSSSSVTPGSNTATVTLTIATIAPRAELAPLRPAQTQPLYAVWMQFQGLGLFGIMLAGAKQRQKKTYVLIVLALLIAALLFMSACAGGTGIAPQGGTAPGTYPITVTATSGTLQHSLPFTLTVQ
jgi:hypothetical protein